jgi:predicted CoA-substrate-specific enzyme activase
MGIDVGSISTKGVVIDGDNKILAEQYIWTEGNPVSAIKKVVRALHKDLPKGCEIVGIGTTGSARNLAGVLLGASAVKNEITAHAVGTLSVHPEVRTILEIGGQDSKIIILENGVVTDYAMNTLCAAGTGSFLSSQAVRLGVPVEEFGKHALKSKNPAKIAARCTVFAESDLVHKAQIGYKKEDIIAGLCNAVVANYMNNLAKGKTIKAPVIFQGGVSKNAGVRQAFHNATGKEILVDERGHLMGALGAAILSKKANAIEFEISQLDKPFETKGTECGRCANNCELISIFKDNKLAETWGSRCGITE